MAGCTNCANKEDPFGGSEFNQFSSNILDISQDGISQFSFNNGLLTDNITLIPSLLNGSTSNGSMISSMGGGQFDSSLPGGFGQISFDSNDSNDSMNFGSISSNLGSLQTSLRERVFERGLCAKRDDPFGGQEPSFNVFDVSHNGGQAEFSFADRPLTDTIIPNPQIWDMGQGIPDSNIPSGTFTRTGGISLPRRSSDIAGGFGSISQGTSIIPPPDPELEGFVSVPDRALPAPGRLPSIVGGVNIGQASFPKSGCQRRMTPTLISSSSTQKKGGFPWLLLVLAGAGAYAYMKKRY
ncbi:MAG: hypothetical protein Q8O68_00570 [Candidatus Daviesbacteria bacterium]|nr:hypothetical protein [Candidatus Daviesbacteria bacterium]